MRILAVVVALVVGCKMNDKPPPPSHGPAVAKAHSPYCPGSQEWPAGMHTCSDDAGCGSGERCYATGIPDNSGLCGAPVADEIHCVTDHDCKRGQICEGSSGRCGSRVASCVPGCTATSCGADEKCGKDLRCAPIPCSEGFACGSGTRCGSGMSADPHGCATIPCWEGGMPCDPLSVCERDVGCAARTCRTSADCPCGSCIGGTCSARPGVCGPEDIPAPA
jgi:hypothetical protein